MTLPLNPPLGGRDPSAVVTCKDLVAADQEDGVALHREEPAKRGDGFGTGMSSSAAERENTLGTHSVGAVLRVPLGFEGSPGAASMPGVVTIPVSPIMVLSAEGGEIVVGHRREGLRPPAHGVAPCAPMFEWWPPAVGWDETRKGA